MKQKRFLVVSCNPDPLSIAVEVDILEQLNKTGITDAINLNAVVDCYHPTESLRDRLYERIDRKFDRFISPRTTGEDLTSLYRYATRSVPELPEKVQDLRRYAPEGVSVGLAALSTAASFARCISAHTADYGRVMQRSWTVAHKSFWAGTALAGRRYDEVFIFNGRHSISRPLSECLQLAGAHVRYYEFDAARAGYFLFHESIHSNEAIARQIAEHTVDTSAGMEFFERNRRRAEGTAAFIVKGAQEVGQLPSDLDIGKYFTFFTSSPDEFFAIRDVAELTAEFSNQFSVALHVAQECRRLGRQFVVRLHPYLAGKHPSWKSEWEFHQLETLGARIIYPSDRYDSYQILSHSAAAITCGSTIGIEAAYSGIPSAVVGDVLSAHVGCMVPAHERQSLTRFLEHPSLPPGALELAIRFGSYASAAGKQLASVQKGPGMPRIGGKLISPSQSLLAPLRNYVRRLAQIRTAQRG
jgi:hypothetical protein